MKFRLSSLTIHKFRDVRPGTTLHFDAGWNVLLGQNATGKTTLLSLISMALRGDFSVLAEESFSVSYELVGDGDDRVGVTLTHVVPPRIGAPDALVGEFPVGTQTTGVVDLCLGGARVSLSIPHQSPLRQFEVRDNLKPGLVAFLTLKPNLASALFDYNSGGSYRFDEALGFFRGILGVSGEAPESPVGLRASGVVGQGLLTIYWPFIPRAATFVAEPNERSPHTIRGDFDACANLARVVVDLGATKMVASWPVDRAEPVEQVSRITLGEPRYLLQRADGRSESAERLSFGQKRLFAFAWYLDANPGPVVADELVNGMHYAWIEDCVHAMEGRQVFLTAQNPLLLDHVGVTRPEDVTSRFILCRNEVGEGGRHVWAWSNPTPEQSNAFFEAYQNGILQVHEILRTEGLW